MNYIQATISSECKKEMEEAITKAFVSSIIEKVNCRVLLAWSYPCCIISVFFYQFTLVKKHISDLTVFKSSCYQLTGLQPINRSVVEWIERLLLKR